MDAADVALLAVAGVTTGAINAVAGGGSLISFPALLATGLSPLSANVTNLIATLPGYLSAATTSRAELADQGARLRVLALAAGAGAIAGTTLLLVGPEDTFSALAPWLVLLACALLAIQPLVARWITRVGPVAVAFFGPVAWLSALVVGAGTLVGGRVGVGVARRLPDPVLRGAVITLGVTVAVVLLAR